METPRQLKLMVVLFTVKQKILVGVISVDFDVIVKILIRFSVMDRISVI
jgi:hypothetical protein